MLENLYDKFLLTIDGDLDDDSKKITMTPSKIIKKLKNHQKTSVKKMIEIENSILTEHKIKLGNNSFMSTNIGILADKVGSGKSLTMLSMIATNIYLENNPIMEKDQQTFVKIYKKYINKFYIKTNIIVVPHNILNQWEQYINDDTNLTFYIVKNKKNFKPLNFYDNINICLISSTQYNKFIDNYENIDKYIFSRIIYDEADTINLPNCKNLNSQFYWFISSSFESLLFPSGEFYIKSTDKNISNYCSIPSFMGYRKAFVSGIKNKGFIRDVFVGLDTFDCIHGLIVKCKNSYIEKSFMIPCAKKIIIHCKMNVKNNIIFNHVSSDIMEMINADNYDGIIEKFNLKKNTGVNLIKIISDDIRNNIHNKKKKIEYLLLININENIRKLRIQKEKNSIKLLKERLNEINFKIKNYNNELCPICYDVFLEPIAITNCCKNMFCLKCLTKYICISQNKSCPLCRNKLENNNSFTVIDNKCSKNISELKLKIEILLDILKKNGKFIIFSAFENTFSTIEKKLKKHGISYSKISGNIYVISNIIKRYRNGDIKVLLMNSQSYGTGMNLEMTTDIIIYHKMKLNIERQLIGRAQRIGRNTQLNIHYLCYENELSSNG